MEADKSQTDILISGIVPLKMADTVVGKVGPMINPVNVSSLW